MGQVDTLKKRVNELESQLSSIEADCAILLKENIYLIKEIKEINPKFDESFLFTSQWLDDPQ